MSSRSIMGFDYGTKSIGVAIGQELTGSARPPSLPQGQRRHPQLGRDREADQEWQPDLLIVGLPLNMDGTDQEITVRAASSAIACTVASASRWSSRTSGSPPRMPAPACLNVAATRRWTRGAWTASPPSSSSKPGWKSSTTKPGSLLPLLLFHRPAPHGPAPGKTRHPRCGQAIEPPDLPRNHITLAS